jgi:hypothetical protein
MGASQPFFGSLIGKYSILDDLVIQYDYLTLYQHADNAQQAFSSEKTSTLHLAIPALEALHRAWFSRAGRPKYKRFTPALKAACTKIDDYYEKTTDSPAYIMAMSKW